MDNVFDISIPTSWDNLSERQLLFAYRQIARQLPAAQVKAVCLFKWSEINVLARNGKHGYFVRKRRRTFILSSSQVEAATHTLDFLDTIPPMPVRIKRIGRHRALPADFQGVPFEQYLYLDNLYQGYLNTQAEDLLRQMAQVLYQSDHVHPTKAQLIGCFYWFASLKTLFAREFPHFLQPLSDTTSSTNLLAQSTYAMLKESTNSQIRALTGGDITKERTILSLDTWRALTELDAKAKEAEEITRHSKR